MRLLEKAGRYHLYFSILIFLVGCILILIALRYIITVETDENLRDAKSYLQEQLSGINSDHTVIKLLDNIVEVDRIAFYTEAERFSDTLIWDPLEKEFDPYRKFVFNDSIGGIPYSISVNRSKLDNEELATTMILTMMALLALFLLFINVFNRYLSLRIWRPFYQTINEIRAFNFNKASVLTPPSTDIDEFAILHKAISEMTTRAVRDYQSLRQFTENASHEIQTPLAIIRSKIELLIQREHFSKEERKYIQDIQESATRLSKLNESLLLLTRIENRQFNQAVEVDIRQLVEKKIKQFEPFLSSMNIDINKRLKDVVVSIDPSLAEILLNNLLGNAIKHNVQSGRIEILLDDGRLRIRNTGKILIQPDRIFERFKKDDASASSLGLGLAIVEQICMVYGYEISYEYNDPWHELTVFF